MPIRCVCYVQRVSVVSVFSARLAMKFCSQIVFVKICFNHQIDQSQCPASKATTSSINYVNLEEFQMIIFIFAGE